MSGDAGDPLAGLSLKERELLQYLEDLQRNNPAEYDMIAKQIQEGGANLGEVLGDGSKAKKKPPAPKGEMVTPEPGFVAKTHSFTHQARKTFVNLCKSDHVDPPAQVEVPGGKLRRPVPAQVVSSVFRFRIPTPTLTLTFTLGRSEWTHGWSRRRRTPRWWWRQCATRRSRRWGRSWACTPAR